MLQLENLCCGYGAVSAVSGVSFEIKRGEMFALLGPNGAGKTSTMLALMGLATIHAGRMLLEGKDISRLPPTERTRLGMALVPEGRRLFSDLTVDENLSVGGYTRTRAAVTSSRDKVFSLFPRLAERHVQISGTLSGGEQQMLAFGRALMAEPRLLLVDELSLGLMPKAVGLFVDVLKALKAEGTTILLVEQNTRRALAIADSVCVLASGKQIFQGRAEEARSARGLFSRYLGIGD
jgi:branched-chain amino acid transport system ATP-binding protein